MDDGERLRQEYDAAVQLGRALADVRFKLLGLVPTVAGAVVAFVSPSIGAAGLVGIGALGLTATVGVVLVELRNAQLARAVAERVRGYERATFAGGPLDVTSPALGDLGFALVYAAALGGWTYLLAWGALHALHVGHPRAAGVVIGALLAAGAAAALLRAERRLDALPAAAAG